MPECDRRPRIGLALSGGGARGLAHIGVLKVLEQEGVPVDCLAGTSMGGVIAAVYAAGLSVEQIEQEALRMSRVRNLITLLDRTLPRRGFFEGRKVLEYLSTFLGEKTFADLEIPLALVAVDLISGQEVILNRGSVLEAVRATISFPGVFAPYRLGEHLLVDGGVLNNLPADVVRGMGADVVIAVDASLSSNGLPQVLEAERQGFGLTQLQLIIETLWRTLSVMENHIMTQKLRQAQPEVLIRPPLDDSITLFKSFPRAAEIIAAGEGAARAALPRITAARLKAGQPESVQEGEAAHETLGKAL
ncbi:MAG: patatin-like phospholipase family protein [Anaerolineae bacterium]|nr:patatin-like phospholipase family protein [Anaerolineae bacterium]